MQSIKARGTTFRDTSGDMDGSCESWIKILAALPARCRVLGKAVSHCKDLTNLAVSTSCPYCENEA
jgi:hypothetical protein